MTTNGSEIGELRARALEMSDRVASAREKRLGPDLTAMLAGESPDLPDLNFRGLAIGQKVAPHTKDLTEIENTAYGVWILRHQESKDLMREAIRVARDGGLEDDLIEIIDQIADLDAYERITRAVAAVFAPYQPRGAEGNGEEVETEESSGSASPSPATSSAGSPTSAPDSR